MSGHPIVPALAMASTRSNVAAQRLVGEWLEGFRADKSQAPFVARADAEHLQALVAAVLELADPARNSAIAPGFTLACAEESDASKYSKCFHFEGVTHERYCQAAANDAQTGDASVLPHLSIPLRQVNPHASDGIRDQSAVLYRIDFRLGTACRVSDTTLNLIKAMLVHYVETVAVCTTFLEHNLSVWIRSANISPVKTPVVTAFYTQRQIVPAVSPDVLEELRRATAGPAPAPASSPWAAVTGFFRSVISPPAYECDAVELAALGAGTAFDDDDDDDDTDVVDRGARANSKKRKM